VPLSRFWVIEFVLDGLERSGIQARAIAASRAIPLAYGSREWVPSRLLVDLWDALVEDTGECGLGLRVAESARSPQFGLFGSTLRRAPNLGEALVDSCRLAPVLSSSVSYALSVEGDRAFFEVRPAHPDVFHVESAEQIVATMFSLIRLAGVAPEDCAIHFPHERPSDLSHHRRVLRAPVRFGAGRLGFDLLSADLHRPMRSADPVECLVLRGRAETLLSTRSNEVAIDQQVRTLIRSELLAARAVSLDTVARGVGAHRRIVNRRLAAHGTNFRELLDRERSEMAQRYLEQGVSVESIAQRLGYSEATAFSRAFKRWHGAPPTRFRTPEPA
jgi:AraC-like DNA-binding protein